jgi:chemotaxis protein MotA
MEGKLKSRTQQEILKREMIIEGVLSIQSGDNPRIVRSKLLTFLAPKDRSEKEVKK